MLLPIGESHKPPTINVTGSGSNEQIVKTRAPRILRRANSTLPTATPMATSAATDERTTYHPTDSGGLSDRCGEPKTLEAAEAMYQRQNAVHTNPRALTTLHKYFVGVFMTCDVLGYG